MDGSIAQQGATGFGLNANWDETAGEKYRIAVEIGNPIFTT